MTKALSRMASAPGMKGGSGLAPCAIHQPMGMRTVLIPTLASLAQSLSVMKFLRKFCTVSAALVAKPEIW